ncbi:MAG: DUF4912 domain-containing protein [Tumebacillaceae bacterium]
MESLKQSDKLWREIIHRIEAGESQTELARLHGMSIGQFRYRLKKHVEELGQAVQETAVATAETEEETIEIDPSFCNETWTRNSNRNRLVLMVKEPTILFAYWEVNELRKRLVSEHFQTEWTNLPFYLQVYDVSDIQFDGYNAHTVDRVAVHPNGDNYYLHHVQPQRRYLADFGTTTLAGRFFTILRSNVVETPPLDKGGAVSAVRFATLQPAEPELPMLREPWHEQFDGYSLQQSKGGQM